MVSARGPRNPANCRLLVVYKKSQLELYNEHQPGAFQSLERKEGDLVKPYYEAHDENMAAIEKVKAAIRELGIEARFAYRAHHEATDGYDLIISIGGDGTLLDVSHNVFHTPLLGVNSSTYSVGHYLCDDGERIRQSVGAVAPAQSRHHAAAAAASGGQRTPRPHANPERAADQPRHPSRDEPLHHLGG